MNFRECDEHAAQCAANAAIAPTEAIAREFLKLAAQWRAMSTRAIRLDPADAPWLERGAILPALPGAGRAISN
jgi:hypothetical protein